MKNSASTDKMQPKESAEMGVAAILTCSLGLKVQRSFSSVKTSLFLVKGLPASH